VPLPVIRAARKRLAQLEQQSVESGAQGDLFAAPVEASSEAPCERSALELLQQCNPDVLSPKEALELLYRMRERLTNR
jgi:DNA mismatch repair protein MutS